MTGTITHTSGELPILLANVSIVGPGASFLSISGGNNFQILAVGDPNGNSNPTVAIDGLSFIDGNSTFGGAFINWGTLTITNSTFAHNTAPGGLGGAIYNRALGGAGGQLTLTNDLFSDNSATLSGAIDNWAGGNINATSVTFHGNSAQFGGAIVNEWGTIELTNSTFTNNTASSDGGAIDNESGMSVTVIGSTFTANTASDDGGGISNDGTLPMPIAPQPWPGQ